MLFKLAVRNIRRSIRDYAIYFVTLLIAITVFYAFNSISDQQVMKDIAESGRMKVIDFTDIMMSIFSIVVALVLGFLVIYANQLLIRRRKHEFGLYFTLGMSAGHVSRVILYETVLVGIVSLILGLGLGMLVSQLLTFATAALFGVPMPNYEFTFSPRALIMTLGCFVAIYVVVAIFNVFSVRRCKLIDLLNSKSSNQKVMIRNPWLCLVLFVISLGIIGIAYWQLQENGMTFEGDEHFIAATVLMLVGTLLLFFSLSGLLIAIITRMSGFYLRGLRPFTTRQVASKANTSFASIWIVCILLFFAITTFATGMALVDVFVKDIYAANPYDASIISYQAVADDEYEPGQGERFDVRSTDAYLEERMEGWDQMVKEARHIDVYGLPSVTYGDVMKATGSEVAASGGYIDAQQLDAMALSQFNELLEMQGKSPVELGDSEYLVTNNMAAAEEVAQEMAKQGFPLQIQGGTFMPQPEVMDVQLTDYSLLSNGCTVVLPDDAMEFLVNAPIGENEQLSYLNVNFVPGFDDTKLFQDRVSESEVAGVTSVLTRDEMISQAKGMRLVITYLALYIGLVLLVTVAAVLAIQLLSLTIDSLSRYRMLSKLGCDMRMLGRSLFAQVALYFLLPLVIAVCHSGWAIHLMTGMLFDGFGIDLLPTILMSAGFVLLIYGGYLGITYFASRAAVVQGLGEHA